MKNISIENDWRKYSNLIIKELSNTGSGCIGIRKIIYQELEKRSNCNLKIRLKNKKERMKKLNCSNTAISKTNFIDVIADDKNLIYNYMKIIDEFSKKYRIEV